MTATPVLMAAGGATPALVLIVTTMFSFALITGVFFFLRWNHNRKNPTKEDIKETNRQRREREKLQRQTKEKVNAYMRGEKKNEGEKVPNGKRSGKYKKKNKKK
ncbi:MAG: hypothetical protein IKL57_02615 [Oscillospiraceae bacterium]|nr:hypothetical protein [Oscillospiraceae bacterium]MBR3610348.1 hypothetical protein [Oscillospiraceae bacterium]MBR3952616.1 hypothetical protein [Oscillospiraceae bacterium]